MMLPYQINITRVFYQNQYGSYMLKINKINTTV